jgi:hypothetical protein
VGYPSRRCSKTWRGVGQQEVGAAHDVGDALVGIVDHHGELVGKQPVAAAEHEVAESCVEPLRHRPCARSVKAIARAERSGRRLDARPSAQAAARSGIDDASMPAAIAESAISLREHLQR